MKFDKKLN